MLESREFTTQEFIEKSDIVLPFQAGSGFLAEFSVKTIPLATTSVSAGLGKEDTSKVLHYFLLFSIKISLWCALLESLKLVRKTANLHST
jgi:hypothetical protein